MKKLIMSLISLLFLVSCADTSNLWPDGRIPFIPIGLNEEELEIMAEAMFEWEIASGGLIKFELTDNVGDGILHITKRSIGLHAYGASSWGYDKNSERIIVIKKFEDDTFDDTIFFEHSIRHELGHCIGLLNNYSNSESIMYYKYTGENNISMYDSAKVIDLYSTQSIYQGN